MASNTLSDLWTSSSNAPFLAQSNNSYIYVANKLYNEWFVVYYLSGDTNGYRTDGPLNFLPGNQSNWTIL